MSFHFLRPHLLWLLVPLVGLYALHLFREGSAHHRWRTLIAPHLLQHLILQPGRRGLFRPVHLLLLTMGSAIVGAAGPTWLPEPAPFTADEAPLTVVLDLSTTMRATDIQPSRLERAQQKVRDLVAARAGAPTGLVAYAGTAHLVLPLTDDADLLTTYVDALAADLMPRPGRDAAAALAVAEEMLAPEEAAGTILFLTDGIPAAARDAFASHAETSRDQIAVLAVGTPAGGPVPLGDGRFARDENGERLVATLDRDGLDQLAREAGAFVQTVTLDDSDVRRLSRRIQSHMVEVYDEDPDRRFEDLGYWLVAPVALLTLLWFRRGWVVSWK